MLLSDVAARPRGAREKALAVNLDERRYGTFAEIGAGQEVVLWCFRASDLAWEKMVPDAVAALIRERGLFGCRRGVG